MLKLLAFIYGVGCYLMFLTVFAYLVVFLVDIPLPGLLSKTVTHGSPAGGFSAIAQDVLLMALFGLQHSVMARTRFKQWIERMLPSSLERSTYVLASSAVLALMMWQWQPIEGVVWQLEGEVAQYFLWSLFGLGLTLTFAATFLTNHFDLFGLRQVYLHLAQKTYTNVPFKTQWFYRIVRHPMMLGLLISLWATPTMTMSHLLFAAGMSIYVFVGIHFEERALLLALGENYAQWRRETPMIVPLRPHSRR